jgi:hypothetical protein
VTGRVLKYDAQQGLSDQVGNYRSDANRLSDFSADVI